MSFCTTIEASSLGELDSMILVGAPLARPTIENGPGDEEISTLPATMAR